MVDSRKMRRGRSTAQEAGNGGTMVATPQSAGRSLQTTPDSVFVSPGTHRQHINSTGTPDLHNFPGNDDVEERKRRRLSRAIDLALSATESPATSVSPSRKVETPTLIPKLSNTQITDHYSTCIKLSTENKITTKNAFGLHLIDYMTDILKQKDSELTNFKIAAGTLDASAKIYAVRVDAVHADVYRVLGGLGTESQVPGESDVVNQDHTAEGSENEPKEQKKRKRSYKTIEQNPSSLNIAEADRKCEIDPMFQRTAASFDECSTVGVFLSTLHCHDYHSALLFDSDVRPISTSEPQEALIPGEVDGSDLKSLLTQCVELRPICPSLSDFRFTQWDSEAHNDTVASLLDKFKQSDQVFDIHAEPEEDDCADAPVDDDFDADTEVYDCAEAGDLGGFKDKREACRMERDTISKQVIPIGEGDISTMCLQLSVKPGEYSYFSPRTMSMWAGPEHWRFRPRVKVDDCEKGNRLKKAKVAYELNFEDDINFDVLFRETRAATTLSKLTLESWNKKSTTLPADFHYDPDNIIRLSLKPANRLKNIMSSNEPAEQDEGIGDYDYNNPNDTSNFCPGLQAADTDDEDGGNFVGPDGMFEFTANPVLDLLDTERVPGPGRLTITTYGEDNLVAEPQKVNKIELHYAKTAKKMDMKRLKHVMWSLLSNAQEKQPDHEVDVEKAPDSLAVMDEKVFSSITQGVLHRLPMVMAQNLSVPLAFACLLHLANEKNLKLTGVEDLSDVLVTQGD
ncbi:condensin complex subunit 2 [Ambystoma mexicanum]|uniref:condensin complex subunit 2 n=1 Tax=Ambystoma mexicanum TaxID=8296 RepID=UPI0037E83E85